MRIFNICKTLRTAWLGDWKEYFALKIYVTLHTLTICDNATLFADNFENKQKINIKEFPSYSKTFTL